LSIKDFTTRRFLGPRYSIPTKRRKAKAFPQNQSIESKIKATAKTMYQ
jgi:hypothetical protein